MGAAALDRQYNRHLWAAHKYSRRLKGGMQGSAASRSQMGPAVVLWAVLTAAPLTAGEDAQARWRLAMKYGHFR